MNDDIRYRDENNKPLAGQELLDAILHLRDDQGFKWDVISDILGITSSCARGIRYRFKNGVKPRSSREVEKVDGPRVEPDFESIKHSDDGGDLWWARELMTPSGYELWQNFERAVKDAIEVLTEDGLAAFEHIIGINKINEQGKEYLDYCLTREGAYAVIQCCDRSKPEIKLAWKYFRQQVQFAEKVQSGEIATSVPLNYSEALRAAAQAWDDAQEAKVRLEIANETVRELLPKAIEFDMYLDTGGLVCLAALGQALGSGRNRLIYRLRELGVLVSKAASQGGTRPMQKYMECGWFEVKPKRTNVGNMDETYATPKGVSGVFRALVKHGVGGYRWGAMPTEEQLFKSIVFEKLE